MINLKSLGAIHFPTPEMLNKKTHLHENSTCSRKKDITALNGSFLVTVQLGATGPTGPRSKNDLEDLGG